LQTVAEALTVIKMANKRRQTPGMRYATARLCANHLPILDLFTSKTTIKIITTTAATIK